MALQYIRATAGLQNNTVSITVFHREIAQTVAAGDGCRRTGDQCAALRFRVTFVAVPPAFTCSLPFWLTVVKSARPPSLIICQPSLFTTVPDAVPPLCIHTGTPIQRGIQCVTMYSLVAVGINHSGICCSFSSHNLTTIFIDGGAYGISANKLPGITIFCIRSPSAPVFTTVSVATAPDLTACQPFSLMTVPVAIPPSCTHCSPPFRVVFTACP